MDPVTIATLAVSVVVAIFASITAPLILAARTERMHREDREANWARQDELAAKTNGKLDVIHTLVNSQLTAAMQSELDAIVRELAMMLEVIELKKAAGFEPTPDALAALAAAQAKIAELTAALEDRAKAQERAG